MPTVRAADLADPVPGILTDPADVALRDRGLGILGHRLHTLTDLIVPSLYAAEPVYRSIPSGELQMAKTVHEGLKACRFPREDRANITGWPREVGRRRVWHGVPLEAMHRAYHIFGQVLFSSFMQWADEEELPRERSIALADDLWHVVDLHRAAATNAFRTTEDEMYGGRRAGELLDALVGGDADRDCTAAVARAWGWVEQARYVVVVCRPADWASPPVEQADLPVRAAGVQVVWRVHGGCALGVAAIGKSSASVFAAALPTRASRRTGVSRVVDNLAKLGHARRLAELAARTVTAGNRVVCLEDRLSTALLTAQPDLVKDLSMQVLAPVLALDGVSRDLLLDTFEAWLATDGSAHHAATALFCHRNSVLNRLRRLERLTKLSLSVPEDLADLRLALEAYRLPPSALPAAANALVTKYQQSATSPPPSTVAKTRPVAGTPDDSRSRIFLCHSRVDKETVRDLYHRLRGDRLDPWFDEEDLQPGQDWEFEIKQVIGKSRFVLVCLSERSITSQGFIHKEIKFALDVADLQPEEKVFIIPIRLEHCSIPDRLKRWHWVDLFESKGYRRLLRALRSESETPRLGRASKCMSIDA